MEEDYEGPTIRYQEKSLFSKLWEWIRPDRKLFIVLNFLIILQVIGAIIGPVFFQKALDVLEFASDYSSVKTEALRLTAIYALSLILIFIFNFFNNMTIAKLNSGVINRMRVDAYSKILRNKVSFFDEAESAKLVSRLMNDTAELFDSGSRFANAFSQIFIFVGVLIAMLYYDVYLAVASLIITPLLFLSSVFLRKFQRQIAKRWRRNISEVNTRFGEVIGSIEISKGFGREEENLTQFKQLNEATYQAAKLRGMTIFAGGPISDFLRTFGLIILLYASAIKVQHGSSVALVYLFILLQTYLFDPISALARMYSQFQSAFAAMERVLSIMAEAHTSEDVGGPRDAATALGAITFKDVNFEYEYGNPILRDLNFEIPAGKKYALVGHTGAGKTTIAALISRFYDIQSGEILLDHYPIQEYSLSSLRQGIGYVSQDILLFSGTIKDNLLLVKPSATDEELWDAIDVVQAREFIETLPHGIDTEVIEGGKNLSKGQLQMLSLARAILVNPKILVLDEFTSSLDLYTESKIQRGIDEVMKNRTSIVIAHRLTTILKADKILVMDHGRLVESGTHQELLNKEGIYSNIFEKYFSFQVGDLKPLTI